MVIEVSTFRLADGVGEHAYLDADERFRTGFLYQQRGLVRATTARTDDGGWMSVVFWDTPADAERAAARASDDPVASELSGLIDAATLERRLATTLD